MKILTLIYALLLISACSNNDNFDGGNEILSCPASIMTPYHEVIVATSDVFPERIAIEVEGEVKYDECLDQAVIPPPPIVRGERTKEGLTILIRHFGAYEQLPEDVSFRVFDRTNCDPDILYFEAAKVPLEFQEVYPNGPKCGSNRFAVSTIAK